MRSIWLNGTSSSGKSTLAAALQESLPLPFLHVRLDAFIKMQPPEGKREEQSPPPWIEPLIAGFHTSICALIDAGNSVIVDHVLARPEWLLHSICTVAPRPVFFVGVHCALDVLQARELQRGDREIGGAESQLTKVHRHGDYDLEVDTSLHTVDECVRRIKSGLQESCGETAFDRMRERVNRL